MLATPSTTLPLTAPSLPAYAPLDPLPGSEGRTAHTGPYPRTTYVPYPVPMREARREGSSFGTGVGLSLGWIAGRFLVQMLMLAILLFVGFAFFYPFLSALRIW